MALVLQEINNPLKAHSSANNNYESIALASVIAIFLGAPLEVQHGMPQ
jgi:hypothetical protein